MRTINVALNETKLATKKLQLTQIENQLNTLKAKLEEVSERYNSKKSEISQIETALATAQTVAPVSK